VLRANKNAQVVQLPWSLTGLFVGRYALQVGKQLFTARWKRDWYLRASVAQGDTPVLLLTDGVRCYWWFHEVIYWEDDGLEAEDVRALVLQRERAARRKLDTAHSLMRAEEAGKGTRVPIPEDVRRAVFERDGGRCVECEASFDLQYDHVIPVALGGATTLKNLQLLCSDCNRRKGALI
jgi:5-methylcytosine-specific restriction endonuclease McrA